MTQKDGSIGDEAATYMPLGIRPGPYPPEWAPDPRRWSGDRLVRVAKGSDEPDIAPTPRSRPTATRSRVMRMVHVDELPSVGRMVLAEAVSDDPGWLAIHGTSISGSYGPDGGVREHGGEAWRGERRRRIELPVGGLLVTRHSGAGSEKPGWVLWRVLPGGPVTALEAEVPDEPGGDAGRAIAAAIDRDLHEAFEAAAERLQEEGEATRTARLEAATASWQAVLAAEEPAPNRRERRRRGSIRYRQGG